MNGIALLEKGEGRELLKKICREFNVPIGLIERLVEIEFEHVGKLRKRGIRDQFAEALDEHIKPED